MFGNFPASQKHCTTFSHLGKLLCLIREAKQHFHLFIRTKNLGTYQINKLHYLLTNWIKLESSLVEFLTDDQVLAGQILKHFP